MGIYAKYVFPKLLDFTMRNREQRRLRAKWIPHARGRVLEVGVGSGLNLAYYSPKLFEVCGIDPSAELLSMAQKRAADSRLRTRFVRQSAEQALPFEPRSFDTAVVTWVLCSLENPRRAMQEIRRVLTPEGELIFVEHGRSPEASVARWQDRITPVWRHVAGGCTLNRSIVELITGNGFSVTELTEGYIEGPRPMTYTYQGRAAPA